MPIVEIADPCARQGKASVAGQENVAPASTGTVAASPVPEVGPFPSLQCADTTPGCCCDVLPVCMAAAADCCTGRTAHITSVMACRIRWNPNDDPLYGKMKAKVTLSSRLSLCEEVQPFPECRRGRWQWARPPSAAPSPTCGRCYSPASLSSRRCNPDLPEISIMIGWMAKGQQPLDCRVLGIRIVMGRCHSHQRLPAPLCVDVLCGWLQKHDIEVKPCQCYCLRLQHVHLLGFVQQQEAVPRAIPERAMLQLHQLSRHSSNQYFR